MADYLRKKSQSSLGQNGAYIEALYEDFLENPQSVSEKWRSYFAKIKGQDVENPRLAVDEHFYQLGKVRPNATDHFGEKQLGVLEIIHNYRRRGHRHADTDPAKIRQRREQWLSAHVPMGRGLLSFVHALWLCRASVCE